MGNGDHVNIAHWDHVQLYMIATYCIYYMIIFTHCIHMIIFTGLHHIAQCEIEINYVCPKELQFRHLWVYYLVGKSPICTFGHWWAKVQSAFDMVGKRLDRQKTGSAKDKPVIVK